MLADVADVASAVDADARSHDASLAAKVRGAPDVVAAYVRADNARFTGGPPQRDPPATETTEPDARQIVTLAAAALFAALFVLTAVFVIRYGLRDQQEHEDRTRTWHAREDARLNRLADPIFRFDETGGARPRKRYVLALRAFEAAATERDRVAIDGTLTALERAVGVLPKKVMPPRPRNETGAAQEEAALARERRRTPCPPCDCLDNGCNHLP